MAPRVKNGPPWTPAAVASEAKRYKTRTEFQKKSYGAYEAALRRYGALDEVCSHMVSGRSLNRNWTQTKIQKIANECRTYSEFRQKHPEAYKAVIRNRWQGLIVNLPRTQTPMGWWTVERVTDEAIKYKTRTAFMKGSGGAYHAAHKNGWLDTVCAHMEQKQKPMRYWSRTRILAEAKCYTCRSEFQKRAAGAYSVAAKNGYLDEACAHMEKKGSRYERAIYAFEFDDKSVYVGLTFDYDTRYREHLSQGGIVAKKLEKHDAEFIEYGEWYGLEHASVAEIKAIDDYRRRGWKLLNRNKGGGVGSYPRKWTEESARKLAQRYKTVKDFKRAHPGAYTVACRKGWWPQISEHMTRDIEHGKWTKEALTKEARNYSSRKEFMSNNMGAYSAASKKGYLDQVCSHMECLVNPVGYWTKARVKQEATKYNTRVKFQKGSKAAYLKAFKMGWLDDVCTHMKSLRKTDGYWDDFGNVQNEAKKYNTRTEFQFGASAPYNIARKNGWLDEICKHMKTTRKPHGYWRRKTILAEAKKYETLKEFRTGSSGAHDAAYKLGLMSELHHILKTDKKPNNYWTYQRVLKEAKKYNSRKEFQRKCASAYSKAHKMGWINMVCTHM